MEVEEQEPTTTAPPEDITVAVSLPFDDIVDHIIRIDPLSHAQEETVVKQHETLITREKEFQADVVTKRANGGDPWVKVSKSLAICEEYACIASVNVSGEHVMGWGHIDIDPNMFVFRGASTRGEIWKPIAFVSIQSISRSNSVIGFLPLGIHILTWTEEITLYFITGTREDVFRILRDLWMSSKHFDVQTNLLMSGWLAIKMGFVPMWGFRWFTLTSSGLTSFASIQDVSPEDFIPIKSIISCTIDPNFDDLPNAFAFHVHTPDRDWELVTETEKERNEWHLAISNAINTDTHPVVISMAVLTRSQDSAHVIRCILQINETTKIVRLISNGIECMSARFCSFERVTETESQSVSLTLTSHPYPLEIILVNPDEQPTLRRVLESIVREKNLFQLPVSMKLASRTVRKDFINVQFDQNSDEWNFRLVRLHSNGELELCDTEDEMPIMLHRTFGATFTSLNNNILCLCWASTGLNLLLQFKSVDTRTEWVTSVLSIWMRISKPPGGSGGKSGGASTTTVTTSATNSVANSSDSLSQTSVITVAPTMSSSEMNSEQNFVPLQKCESDAQNSEGEEESEASTEVENEMKTGSTQSYAHSKRRSEVPSLSLGSLSPSLTAQPDSPNLEAREDIVYDQEAEKLAGVTADGEKSSKRRLSFFKRMSGGKQPNERVQPDSV